MSKRLPMSALTSWISRFLKNRDGAHAIIFAFFLLPGLAATGLAIDTMRAHSVRSALGVALDTAALAAAHEQTDDDRRTVFDHYLEANYPDGRMGAYLANTTLHYDQDTRRLTATATAGMGTSIMSIFGHDSMTIELQTVVQAEIRGMELVLVMDNTGSMRSGNSIGRMKDAARGLVNALFDGRFDTVNRFDETLTNNGRIELENLWVSLVPYSATVNIGRGVGEQVWDGSAWTNGTEHFNWLNPVPIVQGLQTANDQGTSPDAFYQNSYRVEYASRTPLCVRDSDDEEECAVDENGDTIYRQVGGDPRGWLGCVMARPGGLDQTDDPPVDENTRFTPFLWHSNADTEEPDDPRNKNKDWEDDYYNSWPETFSLGYTVANKKNASRGPNLGCPPAITPLTAHYTEIMDAIDNMDAWHRGGTWSNVGMAWGWRTISPRWRSYWNLNQYLDTHQLPLDYDHPGIEKVVVILTDGTNQWYQDDFTSFGYRTEGRPTSEGGLAGATSNGTATAEANSRMATICNRMRRGSDLDPYDPVPDDAPDRIVIYTIVLKASSQQSTFQNCASADENYFFASNNGDLAGIFERIAVQLSNLRIVE